jgi:glycosyltransferase involved in cell wall biosynthesis
VKLLHVVPSYIPAWRYGGPIRSVHGLCAALARRGHEVTVATTNVDGPGDSDVPLGVPVMLEGVAVRYFPSRILRRIYYAPAMRRFFTAELGGYDLVHTHSVFLWPTSAAAHAARRHAKPLVLSPRGMLVPDLVRRRSTLAKRAWLAAFERRNIAHAAAVHSTSALETREMRALGLAPRRVIEIPNGVDGARALDDEPGGAAPAVPARYFLFLGRINWKKGIERLIDALAAVPGAELVVAGNDEEGLTPALAARAQALGVAGRVRFTGYVDGAAKARILEQAVALVLASASENFGNAAAEAMAHGTPVVLSPEVGLADFVRAHGGGLVAESGADGLAQALRAVWSDAGLRARLAAEARAAAREHFSWDHIAARFEAEYDALLAAPRAGPTT